ncbi:MAG TPA: hypothetical protein VF875_04155 [Anaeromyxobacter sp.]
MSPTASAAHLGLTQKEVRILVQSLGNCIATCQTHTKKPDAPCEDCDAARALKKKLEKRVKT